MVDSSSDNAVSDIDHSPLIKSVYKTAWKDFYDWEQAYCLQTLHSLSRVQSDDSSYSRHNTANGVTTPSGCLTRPSQVSDREDETFTVIDYSGEGEPETAVFPVVIVQSTLPFDPCAPYEICTPTNRNISVGDDSDYMPFIPLIDDPTFSAQRHAEDYNYFQWEMPHPDPDLEVILARTVHDLHHKHNLTFQAIDETEILPIPVRHRILVLAQRRDFPAWPAIKSQSQLPHSSPRATAEAPKQLESLVSDFCSNMNCFIGYCNVHMKDMPMPESVPPTVASDDLIHSVLEPCGSNCFVLKNASSLSVSPWSDQDVETIRIVLSLSPDLSPCNLAVICRKPCFEVFKQRKRLIPDSTVYNHRKKGSKRGRKPKLRYHDHDSTIFTPVSGIGPARIPDLVMQDLIVFVGGMAAIAKEQNTRRSAGLRSALVTVHAESVIQKSASSVKQDFENDTCKNISIQRGDRKRTQVRQSQWGLGLYTDEEAKEDDLILEYTGEIVYETTTLCRELVSQHRKRSYLFTLNSTCAIDSTKAGNESRFINHDTKANCYAQVKLVNGEHRIGIFAYCYIPPGTELSLNYGDWFFENDDADKEDTGRKKTPDLSLDQVVYNLDQHSSDETYSGSDSGATAESCLGSYR